MLSLLIPEQICQKSSEIKTWGNGTSMMCFLKFMNFDLPKLYLLLFIERPSVFSDTGDFSVTAKNTAEIGDRKKYLMFVVNGI